MKLRSVLVIAACLLTAASSAHARGTDIKVDSAELDSFSIDDRLKVKDEKLRFYKDENVSVDVNDDGAPNMNMRF